MHLCKLYRSWNNSEAGGRNVAFVIATPKQNSDFLKKYYSKKPHKIVRYNFIAIFKSTIL